MRKMSGSKQAGGVLKNRSHTAAWQRIVAFFSTLLAVAGTFSGALPFPRGELAKRPSFVEFQPGHSPDGRADLGSRAGHRVGRDRPDAGNPVGPAGHDMHTVRAADGDLDR
jgi:hypothetical protein